MKKMKSWFEDCKTLKILCTDRLNMTLIVLTDPLNSKRTNIWFLISNIRVTVNIFYRKNESETALVILCREK